MWVLEKDLHLYNYSEYQELFLNICKGPDHCLSSIFCLIKSWRKFVLKILKSITFKIQVYYRIPLSSCWSNLNIHRWFKMKQCHSSRTTWVFYEVILCFQSHLKFFYPFDYCVFFPCFFLFSNNSECINFEQ